MALLPEDVPARAVMLVWPTKDSDWADSIKAVETCYFGIIKALSDVVPVWVFLHHCINVSHFKQCLEEQLIKMDGIKMITGVDYDDTWIRDYGPLSLSDHYCSFTFNGWGDKYPATRDNALYRAMAEYIQPHKKQSFVCEGGALEINAKGVLLMNMDCVVDDNRNPGMSVDDVEHQLRKYLQCTDIEWLQGIQLSGDDTDGHIDTLARFAPGSNLVYSGRNAQHIDADVLSSLHDQLTRIAQKRSWTLFELPTPQVTSVLDARILPATYANFLIVNKHVFVPQYAVDEDEKALYIIRKAFNNYTIIPVDCSALLEQHGSLHCATLQIAHITSGERYLL